MPALLGTHITSPLRGLSRTATRALVGLLVAPALLLGLGTALQGSPAGAATPTAGSAGHAAATDGVSSTATTQSFGLLGPTSDQLTALSGSQVTKVSLPVGWDLVEPSQGSWNTNIIGQLRAEIASMRQDGFQIVLDLGLQYPPSWVFSLAGQTRFVDQYGDAWHGSLGEDVPNAVYNSAVRQAESTYISYLASALGASSFSDVRVGGLLSGELRYPPNSYNGHSDLLWDYDPAAQGYAPHPGWVPGGPGSASVIQDSLGFYFGALTNYQTWLMQTVSSAFPGIDQEVMLPGWGIRPGMLADAVNSGMRNQSIAEVNGMISSGLDWDDQVAAIAHAGIPATVYTTWLDAAQQAATPQGETPVDYLASLAAQYGLPIAGENTGGGGTSALETCLQRVKQDHLSGMMYMSGGLVANGQAGVSVSDLESAASYLAS